jgi:hypothetical protein
LDWKKSGKMLRKWDAEVTAKGEVVTRDGPPGILYPVSDQPVGKLGVYAADMYRHCSLNVAIRAGEGPEAATQRWTESVMILNVYTDSTLEPIRDLK